MQDMEYDRIIEECNKILQEEIDKEIIEQIRKLYVKSIAEELCSVQPMPLNTLKNLYDNSKSKEELIEEGYKPVSRLGLMWIKE